MNPEFLRNLWLEATAFRLALIAGLVLLAFGALAAMPGPAVGGQVLYCFFVVLWGTRSAALSVVAEIRERTWDSQKLSAIGPFSMVWGKLLGATAHNWFGGLLCLPFILWPMARDQGPMAAANYGLILILLGVLAQSVALLSSLTLIRRNTGNWRLDTFLCQVAGIVVAFSYYTLWNTPDAYFRSRMDMTTWWGHDFSLGDFHFVSLVLFTGWALVGCFRAMRAELRFANGPFVWLAWLAYMALYQAGFESLLTARLHAPLPPLLTRLVLASLAVLASAYGMAFLERKDPVRLRWLGDQGRAGRWGVFFLALDAWMLSWAAALMLGLVLAAVLAGMPGMIGPVTLASLSPSVLAMLGFMTRDVAIFVLLGRLAPGKGDFAALAVLAALYLLAPLILNAFLPDLRGLFLPIAGSWLAVVSGWVQGVAMAVVALGGARPLLVNSR